jgi:hypothetical protein
MTQPLPGAGELGDSDPDAGLLVVLTAIGQNSDQEVAA